MVDDQIMTNSKHIEESLHYNLKDKRRVSSHRAILRGMRQYMHDADRIQKGEELFTVEFEEPTDRSIDFEADLQSRTYTESFWDEASGKPLDYDKVIHAREEVKKRRKK